MKFTPMGELGPRDKPCILGRIFTPSFTPGEVVDTLLLRKTEGHTEDLHPQIEIIVEQSF
jgi:hypothetical protein